VELHGGQVYVTSEVGVGSCFSITLPCSEAISQMFQYPSSQPISTIEGLPNVSNSQKPPLVLLAEDNEANIITISSYLEIKGYQVVVARDGYEAVELVEDTKPDLVLMDIQMPEMDGLEAIKRIRSANVKDLPIIAITALAMIGDREKCIAAGANDYLSKPIKLKQLSTLIQQFCDF
jgi:CheY-like chemotaxis protein